MSYSRNIALIPARSGSKRVPGKNARLLDGKPLIAYTILAAQESAIFDEIIVSTDSPQYMEIAMQFGVKEKQLRPAALASDSSPDIDWVQHTISNLIPEAQETDRLCILRPTSPLRTGKTIRSAIEVFAGSPWASSLRALQHVTEHPGKMWRVDKNQLASPFLSQEGQHIAMHSRPTQSLEPLFVQNASLEITTIASVRKTDSIAGNSVMAFSMPEFEGLDVNSDIDFEFLEYLMSSGKVRLSK
jgi:CMP-N,N'-diacetyllegionaminic acid synthase